jgi:glycosyltransferase involved in cell wall biosynthesis
MTSPKISVLLPTYNASAHVGKAIESILSQSDGDFELIIINDGSMDDTAKVLEQYTDPRIIIIHQNNLGLPKALNAGIARARGIYLARQDADDVSLPLRLEKQAAFLDQHPQYALVGSGSQIMVSDSTNPIATGRYHRHPTENGQLQIELLTNNRFVHSSVMMRKSCLTVTGLYSEDPEHFPPEDYDLWLKMARHFFIANLPEVLLQYLEVPGSISRAKAELIETRATKMAQEAILRIASVNAQPLVVNTFITAANGKNLHLNFSDYLRCLDLLKTLGRYVLARFPEEKTSIATGEQFLKSQLHKALIKSLLHRLGIV